MTDRQDCLRFPAAAGGPRPRNMTIPARLVGVAMLCGVVGSGMGGCGNGTVSAPNNLVTDSLHLPFGTRVAPQGASIALTLFEIVEDTRCPHDALCQSVPSLVVRVRVEQSTPQTSNPVDLRFSLADTRQAAFGYGLEMFAVRNARLSAEPPLPAAAHWIALRISRLAD
jgi:hypothetical protein